MGSSGPTASPWATVGLAVVSSAMSTGEVTVYYTAETTVVPNTADRILVYQGVSHIEKDMRNVKHENTSQGDYITAGKEMKADVS